MYLNFLDAINTTFSDLTKRRMNNIITVCSAPMLDPDWSATLTADQSKTNHGVSRRPHVTPMHGYGVYTILQNLG